MKKLTNTAYESFWGEKDFLAINADADKLCWVEILVALHEQMSAMLSHHCKVLFVRFDLHLPSYTDTNKIMSDLMRKIKRWINQHYQTKRVGHLWVREQERAKQQHYHVILLIDGNKIRNPKRLLERIEEMAFLRNLHYAGVKKPFIMIKRDDKQSFADAFYRGSYLAKQRGKGYQGRQCNNYSSSRIQPKTA